jgi:hypothetical protein
MPNEHNDYELYRRQELFLDDLDKRLDAASSKAATCLFVMCERGVIQDPHALALAVAWQQAYRDAAEGLSQVLAARAMAKARVPE